MHTEHQRKIHELIDSMASAMKIEAERLGRSGGINANDYSPDEYALAKILVTIAAKTMSTLYEPPRHLRAHRKAMNNLRRF